MKRGVKRGVTEGVKRGVERCVKRGVTGGGARLPLSTLDLSRVVASTTTTEWERDDASFMEVEAVTLFRFAFSITLSA